MSIIATRTKCSREGWCSALAERMGEANSERPGLAPAVALSENSVAFRTKTLGVNFRRSRSDHKESEATVGDVDGTMLNYCPWCGADIAFWRADEPEADGDPSSAFR